MTIILLVLTTLAISGWVNLWYIYVGSFILGTLQALNTPSRMAIVSDLVDQDDLMNAVVLNSAMMNAGRIVGPAIAGGIIENVDIGTALYINPGFYLVGTACLLLINGLSRPPAPSGRNLFKDLLVGLKFYWSTPIAFTVITIGFAFGFFTMPYVQVMPAFAKETLEGGAGESGLLIGAAGFGSLLATVVLASLGYYPSNVAVVCRPSRKEAEEHFRYYAVENADLDPVENMIVGRGLNKPGVPEERLQAFRIRAAGGNGALPIVGDPEGVVAMMKRLSECGISALAIGLTNYLDHFPYFRDEVLPRLAHEGLRAE